MTIPPALAFMFPAGYVPWAILPDPGTAPSTVTVTQTMDLNVDLTVDPGEILFASEGATTLVQSWDMPTVTNNGVMWIQHSTLAVTGVFSGNIDVLFNNGTLNAFSADSDATAAFFGSWGLMQNSGSVRAISYAGNATAYATWSSRSWSRLYDSENTGTIEAWSGLGHATGVALANGGDFINTGTIRASGMNNATAFETSGHNMVLTNSGLIEAITGSSNLSIAIFNTWSTEMTINNTGIIRGDYAIYAHLVYNDPIVINNETAGIIEGDISMNNTPSTITNNGHITGNISTGSQSDSFNSINGTFVGVLDLGDSDDVADMGSTDDTVYGGRGNDTIRGHDGNDQIYGDANNDTLTGGAGDDVLDGGTGIDTAEYSGASVDDYSITDNGDGTFTITDNVRTDGTDTLSNIEFLLINGVSTDLSIYAAPTFTENADNVTATAGDDILNGLGGNDIIHGADGNDTINGGAGNDRLYGDDGDDILFGDTGADTFYGGAGQDSMDGGDGLDTVNYRSAAARVALDLTTGGTIGDAAGDTFTSIEKVYGTDFNDTITGTAANEFLYGEDGNDVINGGNGIDRIHGGLGNDVQRGQGGNDMLYGSEGSDQLNGGIGYDIANYKAASTGIVLDTTTGGTAGDAAGDTYFGIEAIYGSDFNDIIAGNSYTNELRGFDGDDILSGGAGTDRLYGGTGSDTASYANSAIGLTVSLETPYINTGEAIGDTYINIENLLGTAFNDILHGDVNANIITGGEGADDLFGSGGDDLLEGGAGNDDLTGGAGADELIGGAGYDRIFYNQASTGIVANMVNSALNTGDAAGDTYDSIEAIYGSQFNDFMTGDSGNNRLVGFDGNDILVGARGNDSLFGGDGNDRLLGGNGNDTLFGQGGSDVYVIRANAGTDKIYGFEDGADVIEYRNGPVGFSDLTITQAGSDVHIVSSNGTTILIGFNIADVEPADFTFLAPAVPAEAPATEKTSVSSQTVYSDGLDVGISLAQDSIATALDISIMAQPDSITDMSAPAEFMANEFDIFDMI